MKAYRSLNPATGELLEEFSELSEKELCLAVSKASTAFLSWRSVKLSVRASLIKTVAEVLEARASYYAGIVTEEMGKPAKEALAEVKKCASACIYYAEHAEELLEPRKVAVESGAAYVRFDPLGPILAIMPWNFPFWQVFRFAVPTLLSGNVVLMKHAPNTPRCAMAIKEIFDKAGLPSGVFQSVFISNEQVAGVLSDPLIRGVSLTGSLRAGKSVAEVTGKNLKPTVLELGGSDPLIVFDDVDIDEVAKAAVEGRFMNNGQSCISPKRILVQKSLYPDFLSLFVEKARKRVLGDPTSEKTQNGPMARQDLRVLLDAQVRRCQEAGATLIEGGEVVDGPGFFYKPSVLTDSAYSSLTREEELFGPVAVLMPFSDEQEAIKIANGTPFGLGSSIWTKDLERVNRLIPEIEAGIVLVNQNVKSDFRFPFGGVKNSGIGRELALEGIREFTNAKAVWIN